MQKYLLYVIEYSFTRNDYVLYIYEVETDDIFHTMGEYEYRAFNKVKRIAFAKWNKECEEFWLREGYTIHTFKNKYDGNGDLL